MILAKKKKKNVILGNHANHASLPKKLASQLYSKKQVFINIAFYK